MLVELRLLVVDGMTFIQNVVISVLLMKLQTNEILVRERKVFERERVLHVGAHTLVLEIFFFNPPPLFCWHSLWTAPYSLEIMPGNIFAPALPLTFSSAISKWILRDLLLKIRITKKMMPKFDDVEIISELVSNHHSHWKLDSWTDFVRRRQLYLSFKTNFSV